MCCGESFHGEPEGRAVMAPREEPPPPRAPARSQNGVGVIQGHTTGQKLSGTGHPPSAFLIEPAPWCLHYVKVSIAMGNMNIIS